MPMYFLLSVILGYVHLNLTSVCVFFFIRLWLMVVHSFVVGSRFPSLPSVSSHSVINLYPFKQSLVFLHHGREINFKCLLLERKKKRGRESCLRGFWLNWASILVELGCKLRELMQMGTYFRANIYYSVYMVKKEKWGLAAGQGRQSEAEWKLLPAGQLSQH